MKKQQKPPDDREKKPRPEITITEVSEFDMGDIKMETTNLDEPFASYKDNMHVESDENVDSGSNVADDNEQSKKIEGLKSGLKSHHLKIAMDGSPPGCRKVSKVSFQSDPNSQPGSRRVSAHGDHDPPPPHQYLHPMYSGIQMAPNIRKYSSQPFGYHYDKSPANSRKTSMEPFYLGPQHAAGRLPYGHGKVSVFSIGNASDNGYIEAEDREMLPTLEHYRVSVFDNQRPTLFQLRDDAQVFKIATVFFT
ncbi:uncharacterized protein LOC128225974 [Mya arenaria]|uniref:uncharacterized protein LOC128225974 n=1 Tax=Mya arenaria TaxID=6604 RepID=UPI0022E3EB34|nr:uncharacterized protein LOC128225974 [Mya arenaria]